MFAVKCRKIIKNEKIALDILEGSIVESVMIYKEWTNILLS
jgi:hypothetical protein